MQNVWNAVKGAYEDVKKSSPRWSSWEGTGPPPRQDGPPQEASKGGHLTAASAGPSPHTEGRKPSSSADGARGKPAEGHGIKSKRERDAEHGVWQVVQPPGKRRPDSRVADAAAARQQQQQHQPPMRQHQHQREQREQRRQQQPPNYYEGPPRRQQQPQRPVTLAMTEDIEAHARAARSWSKLLGPVVDQLIFAEAELSDVPTHITAEDEQRLANAKQDTNNAFKELQRVVKKHQKLLMPQQHAQAAAVIAQAAELQEENERLQQVQQEARAAAAEATSKLHATHAVLHQSTEGHSDISSTFPLSTEIAEKARALGKGSFSELVLEHVVNVAPNTIEAALSMKALMMCSQAAVKTKMSQTEDNVVASIGVPRSELIEGFLRRIWQANHATLLPVDQGAANFCQWFADEQKKKAWQIPLESGEARACLFATCRELTQLFVFAAACDPPLTFDANTVGETIPFDPTACVALDDKIKPGAKCVVFLPALKLGNELKAKAQVLAADYVE